MKISVALCTFNGEKFIFDQLQSIINQTQKVDEIIICDDCSQDNTHDVINQFQKKYPDLIRLYVNESNIGVNKNFEKALSLSGGDYIFLCDQDDIWKKQKTKKIIEVFNKNPLLEGVFSNGDLINDIGEKIEKNSLWDNILFLENHLKETIDLYYYISNIRNMVTGATLCIKKEVIETVFPFPNESVMFHDEWIALILASRKTISYSTEHLISYRIHAKQQIGVMEFSSLKRNLEVIKCILELKTTKEFKYLLQIRKSFFRNYYKFKRLKNSYSGKLTIDLDSIIEKNKKNIIKTEKIMKKSNFFLFKFNKTIDKLTKKRQLT
jgi:glycosyltransferase involved in cell wall biosynthesis